MDRWCSSEMSAVKPLLTDVRVSSVKETGPEGTTFEGRLGKLGSSFVSASATHFLQLGPIELHWSADSDVSLRSSSTQSPIGRQHLTGAVGVSRCVFLAGTVGYLLYIHSGVSCRGSTDGTPIEPGRRFLRITGFIDLSRRASTGATERGPLIRPACAAAPSTSSMRTRF